MGFLEKASKFIDKVNKISRIVHEDLFIVNSVLNEFLPKRANPRLSQPVKDIMEVLDTYEIEYDIEKVFPDCKNIRCLPFDFCIYTKNRFFLIEYDGKQHYEPCFGLNEEQKMENYNRTKHNDTIKEQYCRDHNITLYRIRYDDNHINKTISILRKHRMI